MIHVHPGQSARHLTQMDFHLTRLHMTMQHLRQMIPHMAMSTRFPAHYLGHLAIYMTRVRWKGVNDSLATSSSSTTLARSQLGAAMGILCVLHESWHRRFHR